MLPELLQLARAAAAAGLPAAAAPAPAPAAAGQPPPQAADWAGSRVVSLSSFSKTMAAPGMRLGCVGAQGVGTTACSPAQQCSVLDWPAQMQSARRPCSAHLLGALNPETPPLGHAPVGCSWLEASRPLCKLLARDAVMLSGGNIAQMQAGIMLSAMQLVGVGPAAGPWGRPGTAWPQDLGACCWSLGPAWCVLAPGPWGLLLVPRAGLALLGARILGPAAGPWGRPGVSWPQDLGACCWSLGPAWCVLAPGPWGLLPPLPAVAPRLCTCAPAAAPRMRPPRLPQGLLDEQLQGHVRPLLADNCAALCSALEEEMPGCSFLRPQGGYFIWLQLPPGVSGRLQGDMLPAAAAALRDTGRQRDERRAPQPDVLSLCSRSPQPLRRRSTRWRCCNSPQSSAPASSLCPAPSATAPPTASVCPSASTQLPRSGRGCGGWPPRCGRTCRSSAELAAWSVYPWWDAKGMPHDAELAACLLLAHGSP